MKKRQFFKKAGSVILASALLCGSAAVVLPQVTQTGIEAQAADLVDSVTLELGGESEVAEISDNQVYYKIVVPEAGEVRVKTTNVTDVGDSELLISLYSNDFSYSSQNTYSNSANAGTPNTNTCSFYVEKGTYFIKLSKSRYHSNNGKVMTSVSFESANVNVPNKNYTKETSCPITFSTVTDKHILKSIIPENHCENWFKIELKEHKNVTFVLTKSDSNTTISQSLRVFDEQLDYVNSTRGSYYQSITSPSTVCDFSLDAGTYYLRVADDNTGLVVAYYRNDPYMYSLYMYDTDIGDPMYAIEPEKVTLNKSKAFVEVGKTVVLTGNVTPADSMDKSLKWTSSDKNVATVSKGVVTAKAVGTATIKAKTYNGKSASCVVTVFNPETAVTLNKTSLKLEKGKSEKLTATVKPENATYKNVTWSTSNSKVAVVSNGTVTAKEPGTATITAKSQNGKTATCTVNVCPVPSSITLSNAQMTLGNGETAKLTATVGPQNVTNKTVKWRTSDSKVLTVDQKGNVKAVGIGTAWITATANGNTKLSKSCKITVKNAPSKITLTKGILTIGVGEKYTLGASVNDGAGCAKRTYRTSNSAIVKMTRTDWNGDFYGVKPGVAYVTVRTYNGKESTCKVTVKAAPTSVTISRKNMTMKVGQTATLSCSIPSNAGCATRTFRTSNSNVVKMIKTNWTGSFKAVAPGTAYVTVRTYNGKESTCKVTVTR